VSSFVPAYATSGAAAPDRAGSGFTLGGLSPNVFEMAMGAASCAVRSGEVGQPDTLTVIDYSRPSTEKRLWVFDLRSRRLLYQELVAHGQGSGENMAVTFSNDTDSHRSSLGLFVTGDPYVGKNGYSLRLDGLEDGINDRARERATPRTPGPQLGMPGASRGGGAQCHRPREGRRIAVRVLPGSGVARVVEVFGVREVKTCASSGWPSRSSSSSPSGRSSAGCRAAPTPGISRIAESSSSPC
jgi:L,D-transpeptidase catalytic domain